MTETDTPTRVVETDDGRSAVVSRPVPNVTVEYLSGERGAEAARAVLDGPRCVFCDVPVGEDERRIVADKFGTDVVRPICKGHLEHPESWHRATPFDRERVWYCDECGEVATDVRDSECFDCRTADVRAERGGN
jgi:hypothetical protein